MFLSKIAEEQGQIHEALRYLWRAVRIPGLEDRSVLLEIARVYRANNRLERAHEIITQILSENPRDSFALRSMGMILWRMNKLLEAEEMFLRSVEVEPQRLSNKEILAAFYFETHNYCAAQGAYSDILRVQPTSQSAADRLNMARKKSTGMQGDPHCCPN
jgi:tetratricopeptide (TPR) repeat protein